MKAKVITIIKKTVIIILACLMLVCMIPPWLLPGNDKPGAEGDYSVILPSSFKLCGSKDASSVAKIGINSSVCLKFDIGRFSDIDPNELKSVVLSFSLMRNSGSTGGAVFVSANSDGNADTDNQESFLSVFGTKIAEFRPDLSGDSDIMCETDITDYAKSVLKSGKNEFSIKIFSNMPNPAKIALSSYSDPDFRPCLKTVSGIAESKDPKTLKRAVLSDAVSVSKNENRDDILICDDEHEIYLKFDISDKISQTVNSAYLELNKTEGGGEFDFRVINNNSWSKDNISLSNLPRGYEFEATTETVSAKAFNANLTQPICEALHDGVYSVTIAIKSKGGSAVFSNRPNLIIGASDNPDAICAEAAALETIPISKRNFVAANLPNTYFANDGNKATIVWSEPYKNAISKNGTVNRPKWFEGDALVNATAKIQCGGYVIKRRYNLNIPAETPPDYSNTDFKNYLDIGNTKSETEQKFDFSNMGSPSISFAGGRTFMFRRPEDGASMVAYFGCAANEQNYITFKLSKNDESLPEKISISPVGSNALPISIDFPINESPDKSGFIYATYALPKEYTDSKNNIGIIIKYQAAKSEAHRGIYALYLTQSPLFNPKEFAKQGEKQLSDKSYLTAAEEKFALELEAFPMETSLLSLNSTEAGTVSSPKTLYYDDNTAVFSGAGMNIAFKISGQKAEVYQRCDYYSRYCADVPVENSDGILICNYSDYKLVKNLSADTKTVSSERLGLSGVYKEIRYGKYYSFSKDWQLADDSVIPTGEIVVRNEEIPIEPNSIMLFSKISGTVHSSDWRVSMINGKSVSELTPEDISSIKTVTAKAVGGIPDSCTEVKVMCIISENGKIINIVSDEVPVIQSMFYYTASFEPLYPTVESGQEIKIFVTDNTESLNEIAPKIELP